MNQYPQTSMLEPLKNELENRPNNRAITSIISRHIHLINECINYGYSRQNIYDFIFSENDRKNITLKHFNDNILYRARKKQNKTSKESSIETKKNSTIEQGETLHQEEKNVDQQKESSLNAFERLQQQTKNNSSVNHNSGSSMEDVAKSFAKFK